MKSAFLILSIFSFLRAALACEQHFDPLTENTLKTMIAKTQSEDPKVAREGFAEIYYRIAQRKGVLQTIAVRILGNSGRQNIDDAFQETVIRTVKYAKDNRIDSVQDFEALTAQIFRNNLRDVGRRKGADAKRNDAFKTELSSSERKTVEDIVAEKQEHDRKMRIAVSAYRVLNLSLEQRELIFRRYVLEQAAPQIAREMKRGRNWVEVNLHRITQRIKREIDNGNYELELPGTPETNASFWP